MFKTFFFSEIKYTLRQPLVYVFLFIFALMEFFPMVSDAVQIGGAIGNFHRNSPFTLTKHVTVLCLLSLVMVITFFNNAALRDFNNGFDEILFSTPLYKSGYFFGRFFGALLVSTLPLLGVFVGMLTGTYMNTIFGWMDNSLFGSFNFEMFLNNYLLFILPNMFLAGAIIYALANVWRSTAISFLGGLLIISMYLISTTLTSDIHTESIAGLLDVFGINTYNIETKYFTTLEKNTISPSFSGLLLQNRLIWFSFGVMVLLWSYFTFSFKRQNKKDKKAKQEDFKREIIFTSPKLNPSFTANTSWIQFKSFFHISFLSIIKSTTFIILFLFCTIILIVDLIGGFENLGVRSYPVTYKVIDSIEGKTKLFLVVISIFFSGELIWKDRDAKINEVIDATAYTSFIALAAKFLSLLFTVVVFNLFFIGIGIAYQLLEGYTRVELDVYLLDFFYSNLPLFIVFSAITILVQVLSNNKYAGYFIAILILFVFESILQILDVQSNMLNMINGPFLQYSDMDGFGPGLKATLWYNLYWILLAFICLLVAGALWDRGVKSLFLRRLKAASKEVPKSYRSLVIITIVTWLGVAGFVYYNTQILNPYHSNSTNEQLAAEYEKKYEKHRNVISPKITEAKYYIDIFPSKRSVHAKAVIELTNTSSKPIDSLHLYGNKGWHSNVEIPNATIAYTDENYLYHIYELTPPLQPGQKIVMKLDNKYITKGFENNRGNTKIVHNGTFLKNRDILPVIGYNDEMELTDKNTRRKYGLTPKQGMPKLTKEVGEPHMRNYGLKGESDFINIETVISTSPDQIAVAPGSLINQWKEQNRNYFHYKIDTPSLNFYSFLSAEYKIAKRQWKGVDIEIYYDEKHHVNIEMMLDAVQRSLEYYTKNFGPYHHKQARIIEFPRYAKFAEAYPGTMPYSEAFGFIMNLENETDNNVIDWVVAHEMAHQWWAHQVIGADMQGAKMLSESFAEYSSLMTQKSIVNNPMKMRKFLQYNHDGYLRGRTGKREKEFPLYKTENQGYVHYGKGSIVLFALQDYIGEERVNTAMRNFLDEYKYTGPPYPSSHDFLRHLAPQVPDSLRHLIKDWFKEITLHDNRLKKANYERLDNGKYSITLEIESSKIKSDGLGNETKTAVNDWIDIGFFMDKEEEQLYQQRRLKFNTKETTITIQLDSLPVKAAIDPRRLLIDKVYEDNIKYIALKKE
ncbi:M1 family aminopeptidase [Flagellimonas meridianipacifica]|uniref:Peptidase M1-like protein n=1 Tax=Flagellimonas meridianipacifica TaxID=1080225 RepID=A0A2T0MAF7_9FLAO|nr:M1 family aminopeptidase [Allomuricauda pacifica]PRX54445.1 peptidase M1-like protein [Allomuricauda pacifica]